LAQTELIQFLKKLKKSFQIGLEPVAT